MSGKVRVSVVIPLFNESGRVDRLIGECNRFLLRFPFCEVILADDGSVDDTLEKIYKKTYSTPDTLRALSCEHSGKWGALRHGFLASKAEFVVFLDADLSVSFDEVERVLFPLLDLESVQVLAGDRYGAFKVDYPLTRRVLSRGFSLFARFITGIGVSDPQCPFKVFRRLSVRSVFESLSESGFVGDVELFILLKRSGVVVHDVDVKYVFRYGNFRVVRNTRRMFFDLLRLARKYRCII